MEIVRNAMNTDSMCVKRGVRRKAWHLRDL